MRQVLNVTAVVFLTCLSLLGCAPKAATPFKVSAESSEEADLLAKAFLPAGQILSGFDESDSTGEWRIGDRLLLGFQTDERSRQTTRFVLIELKSGILPRANEVFIIGPADAAPPDAQDCSVAPPWATRSGGSTASGKEAAPVAPPSTTWTDDRLSHSTSAAGGRRYSDVASQPAGGHLEASRAPDAPLKESTRAESASKSVYVRLAEGDDPALIGRLPVQTWSMPLTMSVQGGAEESILLDSDAIFIAVHVYDETGRKMKTGGTLAPATYLRRGLFAGCDLARRARDGEAVDRAARAAALADALISLYGFGDVISDTPVLAGVIRPIIPQPSLWALLTNAGPMFSARARTPDLRPETRQLPALASGRRAYLLPLSITVCKEPALECVLSVTDPSPPFHLCAGIVGIDGVQVKDPSCKFSMRLLAARRAPMAGRPS